MLSLGCKGAKARRGQEEKPLAACGLFKVGVDGEREGTVHH